jgi:hypothetical protein
MTRKISDSILADGKHIKNISRWVYQSCNKEIFDRAAIKEINRQKALKSKVA